MQKNLTLKFFPGYSTLKIVKSKTSEMNNTQNQSIKRNVIKRLNERLEEDG